MLRPVMAASRPPYPHKSQKIIRQRKSITDQQRQPWPVPDNQGEEQQAGRKVDAKSPKYGPCLESFSKWKFTAPKLGQPRHDGLTGFDRFNDFAWFAIQSISASKTPEMTNTRWMITIQRICSLS